jgi:hypothetical protein
LYKEIAQTPKKGRATPETKIPKDAIHGWDEASTPTKIGKTKLPDPKNMENRANPNPRVFFKFLTNLSPFFAMHRRLLQIPLKKSQEKLAQFLSL